MSLPQTAVIVGAGPAGLTAAFELLARTQVKPIILEMSARLGGIATTLNYKGNRIDIGGHRFFSKSDRVMQWWLDMLPMQAVGDERTAIRCQNKEREVAGGKTEVDPNTTDQVMLLRQRKSRIYYLRKFFDYPISLSKNTIRNLGLLRMARIGASYLRARLLPIRNEQDLEQFLINRFGRELYLTFFKSYTEKVWGVPCQEISAAWGAQRIKGLSITKAIWHALSKPLRSRADVAQKRTETSLIEQFLYPKYGPGQMWETCAQRVTSLGGEIRMNTRVDRLHVEGGRVTAVDVTRLDTGQTERLAADYVFSTMPVQDLIRGMSPAPPANVREVAEGLVYRDFITVGLLVNQLKIREANHAAETLIRDNWIYIQEPDVQVGRLQIFNNWSPWMVADRSKVWLGLEYFCNEGDDLWESPDEKLAQLGAGELAKIGILDDSPVLDWTVIRMPKTYPAYFGTYGRFDEIRQYVDRLENLFLIGRNGMHRYNNQDHSMLTAMTAVDNIVAGRTDHANIWELNTEQEYHETKENES